MDEIFLAVVDKREQDVEVNDVFRVRLLLSEDVILELLFGFSLLTIFDEKNVSTLEF